MRPEKEKEELEEVLSAKTKVRVEIAAPSARAIIEAADASSPCPFQDNNLQNHLLPLILMKLSFGDWASASRVSKVWYARAQETKVKEALSRKILPWLAKRFQKSINELHAFIRPHELYLFLKQEDIPIPAKVIALHRLKSDILSPLRAYKLNKHHFPFTLNLNLLHDAEGKSFQPLFNVLDSLNSTLIGAFRFQFPNGIGNLLPHFNRAFQEYSLEETPPAETELPDHLKALLEGEKTHDFAVAIYNFEQSAPKVRGQYLRNFALGSNIVTYSRNRTIFFVGALILSVILVAVGAYWLASFMQDDYYPHQVPDWYFNAGLALVCIGGTGVISLGMFSFILCQLVGEAALGARGILNNNAEQNPRIEAIEDTPSEKTALLPDIEAPEDPGSANELRNTEGLFDEERRRYEMN